MASRRGWGLNRIHRLSQPRCPRDAQESGWGTLGSFAGLSGGSRCSAPGSGTRKGCSFSIFASPAWGGESAHPRAPTPGSKALSPRRALLMPARWSNMNKGGWGKGRHGCWSQDLAAQFCPPFCVTLDKSLPLSRPQFPSVTRWGESCNVPRGPLQLCSPKPRMEWVRLARAAVLGEFAGVLQSQG